MKSLRNKVYQLLRRSEAFFKTDMVYLAKGGFWLIFVQLIGAVSAFALSVAFAHLFPKDSYGTYKYVIALSGIIGTLTLIGLGPAITQSVARGFDGALFRGFKTVLKWGVIILTLSLSLSIYYLVHHNYVLAFSLFIIGITSPLIDASSFFNSYLNGKKDFKTLSILSSIGSIFPALCLILTLFITENLFVIIFVYFISYTTILYTSYRITVSKYHPHGEEDPEMIPYAKHLTFISILNTLADQADKIIVYHYVGAVELAVYSFAIAVPLQIKGMFKSFFPLALPKFAIRSLEEIKSDVPNKTIKFLFVLVPVVILYIVVAPFIYKTFFPQYMDAVRMSQIFSLSLLAYISIIPTTILQAKKTLNSLYGSNMSIAVAKLALLFIGVKMFGLWGVIYARIAYEFVALLIAIFFLKRARETTLI
ncbi:oligosaccharide flippase family protein [Candidatus Parcubacteria bacterium]|nr:oligosaccharide flippase family protein [Candidatus Parcubacteria bacterium]